MNTMKMESPVVEVTGGKLSGCILETTYGDKILGYLGIQYAKPPIADLRFKAPVPTEPWEGVRSCALDSHPCVQMDPVTRSKVIGSEDCLYLNIYTKSVRNATPRPVLVFIHGGAFSAGMNSRKQFGPDYLLVEDVVLVTVNYRLGMLGFLSLEDLSLEVPGNAGLKDQTLALKWVKNNIAQFGGDTENITIMGQSAGSVSAHLQVLSDASNGLFHKAILLSGVALHHWAMRKTGALEVLKLAGIDANDEKGALEFLMQLPADEVYILQEKCAKAVRGYIGVFVPVVEKPNPTALITELPQDLILKGRYNHVPLMLGYCDREGLFWEHRRALARRGQKDYGAQQQQQPQTPLTEQMAGLFKLPSDSDIVKDLVEKIQVLYLSKPEGQILLETDVHFLLATIESAELHCKTSSAPVYFYEFALDTKLNYAKQLGNLSNPGACHADDLGYIFKNALIPTPEEGSVEDITMRRMVKLIANFAKSSNPTPADSDLGVQWRPVEEDNLHYLTIGRELSCGVEPEAERMQLWREFQKSLSNYRAK